MEESKEQQRLHRLLQFGIYLSVAFDVLVFVYAIKILAFPWAEHYGLHRFFLGLSKMLIYQAPLYSKAFTLLLICLTSVGTLSRKQKDLNPKNSIVYPMCAALFILGLRLWCYGKPGQDDCFGQLVRTGLYVGVSPLSLKYAGLEQEALIELI